MGIEIEATEKVFVLMLLNLTLTYQEILLTNLGLGLNLKKKPH